MTSPRTPLRAPRAVLLVRAAARRRSTRSRTQEMIAADPLPLAKGAKWTYNVTVKRFDADADKETTKTLEWTTEVIDVKRSATASPRTAIKGWPTDLADFDPAAPVATEKTILRRGNNFLFGATAEPTLDGAEGWFSWPVIDGQKICPSAEMVYCWQRQRGRDRLRAVVLHRAPTSRPSSSSPAPGSRGSTTRTTARPTRSRPSWSRTRRVAGSPRSATCRLPGPPAR